MKILIDNMQHKLKIDKRKLRSVTFTLLKYLSCADKEISLCFVDDNTIKQLNKQYRHKNKPTNVLSFSLQEGEFGSINPDILGDIVISVDTAKEDAIKKSVSIEREFNFLIIHGLLHLLGYNHENSPKEKARIMQKKEEELLKFLYKADQR
ncbi:MAG: rRNA maturation RNase YbeY [Deltaproteobacteria bacterium HGW-Deltaproteobacteria-12]|jgi:probable rRNA maturation factor|nr:MAG: rRNA maturation RNase YbeY [Deltaproteobacteria bacterium HGW-Deltaproteobacteria-12]